MRNSHHESKSVTCRKKQALGPGFSGRPRIEAARIGPRLHRDVTGTSTGGKHWKWWENTWNETIPKPHNHAEKTTKAPAISDQSYSNLTRNISYIHTSLKCTGPFCRLQQLHLRQKKKHRPQKFGHFSEETSLPHLAMVRITYKLQREPCNAKQVAGVDSIGHPSVLLLLALLHWVFFCKKPSRLGIAQEGTRNKKYIGGLSCLMSFQNGKFFTPSHIFSQLNCKQDSTQRSNAWTWIKPLVWRHSIYIDL